jgi:hypothetical protein
MMNERKVECKNHGLRKAAFVCQHLNKNNKTGFHEPYSDKSDPNQELQAWCDECEKVLSAEGEWNDKSESFAKVTLICDACFFEIKHLNLGN